MTLFSFFLVTTFVAAFAVAGPSKLDTSPELQKTVRNLLGSGGALNASDFGVVPEVQVVDSYKIVSASTLASVTTIRVELKISAVKRYDESTHRYKEKKLSKVQIEQIVIELKTVGAETSLVHSIGSYSLR